MHPTPYGISVASEFTPMPRESSAILGDILHNLRSTLDLVASELARRAGRSDKNVYFPIADKADELPSLIKKKNFHYAGPEAVALLKTFAPYRGGNTALRAIHELDIRDKHTALMPTAAEVSFRLDVQRRRDGKELRNPSAKVKSVKFVFPDNTPLAGDELFPTLENLVEVVNGIVKAFVALVTPTVTTG